MTQTPEKIEPVTAVTPAAPAKNQTGSKEIGGRKGPEPVRYGDWEKDGKCVDF